MIGGFVSLVSGMRRIIHANMMKIAHLTNVLWDYITVLIPMTIYPDSIVNYMIRLIRNLQISINSNGTTTEKLFLYLRDIQGKNKAISFLVERMAEIDSKNRNKNVCRCFFYQSYAQTL